MDIGEENRNQIQVVQEVNPGVMDAIEEMNIENKQSVVVEEPAIVDNLDQV